MTLNRSNDPDKKSILVVVPLPLMSQWYSEIKAHTNLKAFQYYGPERGRNVDALPMFDIILTTYETIRDEGRPLMVRFTSCQWAHLLIEAD
jgi:SNF2 family DNA or RNA helicase